MTPEPDTIDLTNEEMPGDLRIRLECTKCPPRDRVSEDGSEDFVELPAQTKPVRRKGDPKTVVRCAECGKKHGKDSLTVV